MSIIFPNVVEHELMQSHPDALQYRGFADIPKHQLSETALIAWLCHEGKFAEIPAEWHTQDLLVAAARHDRDAYLLIEQRGIGNRSIAFEAVIAGRLEFHLIPEKYQDEVFLLELVRVGALALQRIDFSGAYRHLLTERVVESICTKSVYSAYEFACLWCPQARYLVKDDYIKKAIGTHALDLFRLKELGAEHVLREMLCAGYWPTDGWASDDSPGRHPPVDSAACFSTYLQTIGTSLKVLHRCWLQTRPAPELVKTLAGSERGLDVLFEIIPINDLRALMGSSRAIRGRLLENDLGM